MLGMLVFILLGGGGMLGMVGMKRGEGGGMVWKFRDGGRVFGNGFLGIVMRMV